MRSRFVLPILLFVSVLFLAFSPPAFGQAADPPGYQYVLPVDTRGDLDTRIVAVDTGQSATIRYRFIVQEGLSDPPMVWPAEPRGVVYAGEDTFRPFQTAEIYVDKDIGLTDFFGALVVESDKPIYLAAVPVSPPLKFPWDRFR